MRFIALAFSSIAIVAACGPSVSDACTDYATAYCNQQYKCQTGTALENLQKQYGTTAADCATVFGNCTSALSPCAPGLSYDTGQAENCVSAYAALSCEDIQQNTVPDACETSKICH